MRRTKTGYVVSIEVIPGDDTVFEINLRSLYPIDGEPDAKYKMNWPDHTFGQVLIGGKVARTADEFIRWLRAKVSPYTGVAVTLSLDADGNKASRAEFTRTGTDPVDEPPYQLHKRNNALLEGKA